MQRNRDFGGDKNRTALVGVLAAIVLIGLGFVLGRLTAPEADTSPGTPNAVGTPGSSGGVGPRALSGGVPVGYKRSEEGALQAAINYSRALSPGPGESEDEYAAKLRAIASDEWGDELESTIQSWNEGEAEIAPLRSSMVQFSEDRAEVVLWFASFVNPRNGAPGSVWGRAFLTLVWEEDDWKVASEDGDAGPWPAPLSRPSSSNDLSTLLTGFEAIEYEPAALP